MSRGVHVPIRLCMGCGERAPQATLWRIAVSGQGTLSLVTSREHTGRNGYLHRRRACYDRFMARKGLLRSLGRALDKTVRGSFVAQLENACSPPLMG